MKNKWEESLAALSVGQQFAYKVKDDARKDKIRRYAPLILLVIMTMIGAVSQKDFFTWGNVVNIMYQMSIPLVISVGLTYVLLLGSIDLSIEGVMGFAGSFVAFLVVNNSNSNDFGILGILFVILISTFIGAITGIIHVKARIATFIVTYAVGSIMTAEFIDLKGTMTAAEAIRRIRRLGGDCESIYTCYVTDGRRVLDGVVTLRELLLAPDNAPVRTLMEPNVITVRTTDDQELAVRALMRYDFLSLPVVDQEDRLVGVVTVDDVMDVMEEEATEDFQRMAAMAPSEKSYLKTGVFALAKNRILWLLVLMISGMITGGILGRYEAAFSVMPLLVTFIPMLTDTGGNAGSQSSTLVIRGMAVGDIALSDFPKVLWKELRVSLLVGAVLSLVNLVRLLLSYPGNELVCVTVTLSLFATVVLAKTIGGALPMLAKLVRADPAIMAAPLITTIVDALSLVLYFTIASRLLHL